MFCIYDKDTKKCLEVGTGTNTDFYKSIGMEDLEVEQAYDGSYYLKGYAPIQNLDELKSEKLSELTSITSKFTVNNCDEMHITSSLGYTINADKTAQDNIRGLIEAHGESDIIKYKIYDNSFKEVTIADLKIMLKECAKNGENLYTQKFLYQEKIKACTSADEINAIEFVFNMMDFSKPESENNSKSDSK